MANIMEMNAVAIGSIIVILIVLSVDIIYAIYRAFSQKDADADAVMWGGRIVLFNLLVVIVVYIVITAILLSGRM